MTEANEYGATDALCGSTKRSDAVTVLNQRHAEVQEDRDQGPQAGRLSFEDIAEAVTTLYAGKPIERSVGIAFGRLR